MGATAGPAPGFAKHPDRRITLEPLGESVRVSAGGIELAASGEAILLREGDYAPVIYVPFSDIEFDRLTRTDTSTHCPFKGDASYWRVTGSRDGPDVMWSYEKPYDEMVAIKGFAAFYGDRVKVDVG